VRLATRRAIHHAALGAWVGGAAALLWLLLWLLRVVPLPHSGLVMVPIVLGALIGAIFGRLRQTPDRAELALLLDSLLGTEEAATTVVEMEAEGLLAEGLPSDPRSREVLVRLGAALTDRSHLRDELSLSPPRHVRFLPLILLALAFGLTLPRVPERDPPEVIPGDLADEAERLEERKVMLEQRLDSSLPDELEDAFDALVEEMKSGAIDKAGAIERASALREKLDELAKNSGDREADGSSSSDALESVDEEAAKDLADALRQGDLEAAFESVDGMRERMAGASDADKERAARELERASRAASEAGNESLAEALKEEAERAREGQQGEGQQGEGQQGEGQEGSDGLAGYLEKLQQGGALGDMAAQSRQMEIAQELNGALGGAQGRLGQGQSEQQDDGAEQSGEKDWGAGSSHTDAVVDPFSTDGADHQDMNRQLDGRHSSWLVEEFGENSEERLQGVKALTQSVNVPLGEGPIDSWELRLNRGAESSVTPLSSAPPVYRAAAEEAMSGEAVPRAYRDQVKQYFDLNKE